MKKTRLIFILGAFLTISLLGLQAFTPVGEEIIAVKCKKMTDPELYCWSDGEPIFKCANTTGKNTCGTTEEEIEP